MEILITERICRSVKQVLKKKYYSRKEKTFQQYCSAPSFSCASLRICTATSISGAPPPE